jgi:hypothetical protein
MLNRPACTTVLSGEHLGHVEAGDVDVGPLLGREQQRRVDGHERAAGEQRHFTVAEFHGRRRGQTLEAVAHLLEVGLDPEVELAAVKVVALVAAGTLHRRPLKELRPPRGQRKPMIGRAGSRAAPVTQKFASRDPVLDRQRLRRRGLRRGGRCGLSGGRRRLGRCLLREPQRRRGHHQSGQDGPHACL